MIAITKCTILENTYKSILDYATEILFQIFSEKKLTPLIEIRHENFNIYELISNRDSFEIISVAIRGSYNFETEKFEIISKILNRTIKRASFDNSVELSNFLTSESFFNFIIESANLAADSLHLIKNF